jgi:DNA mismatch repair protein MutS2
MIEKKLDLMDFLEKFKNFFSREKEFLMEGDVSRHLKYISSLEEVEFSPPQKSEEIWESIKIVRKFGILSLREIFEILKIVRYFKYLQSVKFFEPVSSWIAEIRIPDYFLEIDSLFDKDGKFLDEADERLRSISRGIS